MVKLNRRLKLLISLIAFVAVGWICFQPLSKIGVNKSYLETPKALHKLSQDELIDFLMLWDQMQKGELKGYLEQIPLKNEEGYPRPIVKWLELNNWSVERFFYDEQRIRDILSCVNLERNLNTNVEVSKKTGINLTELVSHQKQGMEACSFEKEEMKLIEDYRKQIMSIFAE